MFDSIETLQLLPMQHMDGYSNLGLIREADEFRRNNPHRIT